MIPRTLMPRASVALLLVSLAACGTTAPANSPQATCEQAANDDPAVKDALGKAAGNLNYQWQHEGEIKQAKLDAVTKCLRARGLAPRGGVERPR